VTPTYGSDESDRDRLRLRTDLIPGEEEFRAREMVAWFHPFELARTAVRALLATVVTSYADSRMAMAAAAGASTPIVPKGGSGTASQRGSRRTVGYGPTRDLIDLSDYKVDRNLATQSEIWFDYLADTADGFDSTYAMACVLGCAELGVEGLDRTLPRGKFLVMGGDLVYPWPSRELYRDRFQVPFRWAWPCDDSGIEHRENAGEGFEGPLMLAIPGNHDWYDGLRNFLSIFCDGRRIGAWRTVQRRSYFAVKLPHGWQLWGNDAQLTGETDRNQLAFFRSLSLDRDDNDEPSAKQVILCTAKPAWLEPWGDSRRSMRFFEEEVVRWPTDDPGVRKEGPELPVTISGDLHFYARHCRELGPEGRERHRIVCGGGGAYTRGTHDVPTELTLLEREALPGQETPKELGHRGDKPDTFQRERNRYQLLGPGYPDRFTSRRLARGALRFPLHWHNLPYCIGWGILLASIAGFGQWSSRIAELPQDLLGFLRTLRDEARTEGWSAVPSELLGYAQDFFYRYPMGAVLPILTAVVFMAFFVRSNPSGPRWTKWAVGLVWVAMAAAVFAWTLMMLAGWIANNWLLVGAYAVASGLLAGELTGVFLWLVNRLWGWNSNEVFSCQSILDYHSFLRCHIDTDGALHIYPIGVEVIPRRWRRRRPQDEGDERDDPSVSDAIMQPIEQPLRAHLIEAPIVIRPKSRVSPSPAGVA
jgi:hypothetical protein